MLTTVSFASQSSLPTPRSRVDEYVLADLEEAERLAEEADEKTTTARTKFESNMVKIVALGAAVVILIACATPS